AAWLHYLATERSDAGASLVVSDPGAPALAAKLRGASTALDTVQAALSHTSVFGATPWPQAFAERLAGHLQALRRHGTTALLACAAPA
ncbi:MAG TPA: mannitol dehydrogenase family protein, partial [Paraburkholderia sp.]|nr:mannitol dehydrogenase family protein [Paraburkholderia sp.]